MPKVRCRDIEIDYHIYGDLSQPVLIGVQGLAEGWRFWPRSLCDRIVEAGYCFAVIDNRDIGGSTIMDAAGPADIPSALGALAEGKLPEASYTVETLGDDIVAFMDALDIPKAHLIGYSMGGVACQWATLNHPDRILSLIPLMTTSGNPQLQPPRDEALGMAMGLVAPLTSDDDSRDRIRTMWTVTTGKGYPAPDEEREAFVDLMLDHGFRPEAIGRQLLSNYAAAPQFERLSEITCPTTIIHGTDDCFFSVAQGKDLAERIVGSRLQFIDGAGHNFAESLMPTLGIHIIDHMNRATASE